MTIDVPFRPRPLLSVTRLLAVAVVLLGVTLLGAAGARAAGSCANEQLRQEDHSMGLPDCRAYELVSPSLKFGEPVYSSGNAVTSDGSRVAFSSLGAFGEPGNDSSTLAGEYVGVRGASGWSAVPVNPSATEFWGGSPESGSETVDFSADLSHTLFLQAPVSGKPVDFRFNVRRLDGSFTEVGPLVTPQAVAAWTPSAGEESDDPSVEKSVATGDLSHVFFEPAVRATEINWLWPGDETARNGGSKSLYEYTGTGNSEPELVGIKNQTSLAEAAHIEGKSHINEAAEEIGQCGASLGDGNGEGYNSFSTSGEIVFFTVVGHRGGCAAALNAPAVNELYARLGRERTVAISEPSKADCATCETFEAEPEKRSSAIFRGASEDGSKVFLLSEQKLISGPAGLEPKGENLYQYDFNAADQHGKVSLIAPEMEGVARIAESGSRVYLVSASSELAHNIDAKGELAHAGDNNLYLYDTASHEFTFIAALSGEDQGDWQATDYRPVEATPDGHVLLFASTAALTPDASGAGRQLYRYEAPTSAHSAGMLVRVTVGEGGFNEDGNAAASPASAFAPEYAGLFRDFTGRNSARPRAVSISNDGSKVFFESPLALTPDALNNRCAFEAFELCVAAARNIYEWDDGHVYLISDGRDAHARLGFAATTLIGANPSGSDVFFTTADRLVSQDTDTQVDIYDAHIGGGFPAAVSTGACQGEACQGSSSAPPVFGSPSSATLSGAGNLASPPSSKPVAPKKAMKKHVRCARGKKLRHGKCTKVSKVKKKAKKANRAGKAGGKRRGK
jgi:hypothetical protein